MSTSPHIKPAASPLPPELAAVALIDAKTSATPGGMSVSWWHARVAAGQAPQPAVRKPRCTRWRVADVAAFWVEFSKSNKGDIDTANRVMAQAVKASSKAAEKRKANELATATAR